jgi:hypothetical protein
MIGDQVVRSNKIGGLSGLDGGLGQSHGKMRFADAGRPCRITLAASCTKRKVRSSLICRSSIDG